MVAIISIYVRLEMMLWKLEHALDHFAPGKRNNE
jgi:hypothetical protein